MTPTPGVLKATCRLAPYLVVVPMVVGAASAPERKGPALSDEVRISISNEVIHPVSDLLFGQFMERPSWGGETGPEAAVLPGTHRLDSRVEALLRKMDIPVVRFPGGTDVDYLDWQDMVSDAHGKNTGRPLSRNTITNAFGYDEYFRLAADLKWQSILVVNLHDGLLTKKTLAEAADHAAALLAYCAGRVEKLSETLRPWPELRARNGHPEPYAVEYVQIGNETWCWGEEMKKKHGDAWVTVWADAVQAYIAALRRVQPGIKVIVDAYPLEVAAELHRRHAGVELYALHRYYPWGIGALFGPDGKKLTEKSVIPKQIWETLIHCTETDADGLAEWQDGSIEQAKRLGYKLALTEWNLNGWWQLTRGKELWPGNGACGLGAAVMLNAMMRRGDTIALGTQSMLLGQSWGITGIRVFPKTGEAPVMLPTAEATTLYNHYHGDRALRVRYQEAPPLWRSEVKFSTNGVPCAKAATVDVVATRSRDRLYLHAINTEYEQTRSLRVRMDGFKGLAAEAITHCLRFHTSPEFDASRVWTRTDQSFVRLNIDTCVIELPPRSVTIAIIDLGNPGTDI